jgi:hypothetical protein
MLLKEEKEIIAYIGASKRVNEALRYGEKELISEIDLGIIGSMFSSLTSGKIDAFKEYFIDAIFDYLGFTSDNILGMFLIEFIKEFIENVILENPTRIMSYFDDEKGCEILADDMVLVMGKAGGDIFLDVFVDYIKSEKFVSGLQNDLASGSYFTAAIGSVTAGIVNAISDSIILGSISKTLKEVFQNEILEELQPFIRETICNMPPLSEVFGSLLGFGGKAEAGV